MDHFAGEHLAALASVLVLASLSVWSPRFFPRLRRADVGKVGGVALAAVWVAFQIDRLTNGFSWSSDLPVHLSDWAVLAAVVALVTRNSFAVELVWFWALAGASWAVFTPDITRGLEAPSTWAFFALHGGAIAAALWLVLGCRIGLEPGAAVRGILATLAVTGVAGIASLVSGGNYMFLREPPSQGSLLDVMGPWPWYLLSAAALAVALIVTLAWIGRRFGGAGTRRVEL